jgi:hypothetical protein
VPCGHNPYRASRLLVQRHGKESAASVTNKNRESKLKVEERAGER